MEKKKRKGQGFWWKYGIIFIALITVCWLFQSVALAQRGGMEEDEIPLIKVGDTFPHTELKAPKSKADRDYLGISDKAGFYLNEVKANVLIVEFMNVRCVHCIKQAPILDEVYAAIGKDPKLKGRVKLLSIGVGNRERDMEQFRKEKKVPFPMIPDRDFVAMENIGYPEATPFIMILKKEKGNFVVKYAHLGMVEDPNTFLDKARKLLEGVALKPTKQNYTSAYHLMNPHMTKEKVRKMGIERLASLGYQVVKITRLNIRVRRPQQVYAIKVKKDGKTDTWFAVVGAEGKICDVCHDVYFIYTFDKTGTIRDLLPIQFPKKGNKEFTKAEVEKTRKAIVGKNVLKPIQFNEETDAVTSGTMTSHLIFRSVNRGRIIYEKLKKAGYIK